jgi:hypothetical protein
VLKAQKYNCGCLLCGVKLRALTLREENRLRVFKNKVLRKIFGPERENVTGFYRSA